MVAVVPFTARPAAEPLTSTNSAPSASASSSGSSVNVPLALVAPAGIVRVKSSTSTKSSPAVAVAVPTCTCTDRPVLRGAAFSAAVTVTAVGSAPSATDPGVTVRVTTVDAVSSSVIVTDTSLAVVALSP